MKRWYQQFSTKGDHLAHTIWLLCCKPFVGTNLRCKRWIIGILGFRLGKKALDCISPDGLIVALRRFSSPDGFFQLYVEYTVVASLWREMPDTRRNRATTFWYISGMSIVTLPVLNRDDSAPI